MRKFNAERDIPLFWLFVEMLDFYVAISGLAWEQIKTVMSAVGLIRTLFYLVGLIITLLLIESGLVCAPVFLFIAVTFDLIWIGLNAHKWEGN